MITRLHVQFVLSGLVFLSCGTMHGAQEETLWEMASKPLDLNPRPYLYYGEKGGKYYLYTEDENQQPIVPTCYGFDGAKKQLMKVMDFDENIEPVVECLTQREVEKRQLELKAARSVYIPQAGVFGLSALIFASKKVCSEKYQSMLTNISLGTALGGFGTIVLLSPYAPVVALGAGAGALVGYRYSSYDEETEKDMVLEQLKNAQKKESQE